jgi:hypothetical protein
MATAKRHNEMTRIARATNTDQPPDAPPSPPESPNPDGRSQWPSGAACTELGSEDDVVVEDGAVVVVLVEVDVLVAVEVVVDVVGALDVVVAAGAVVVVDDAAAGTALPRPDFPAGAAPADWPTTG